MDKRLLELCRADSGNFDPVEFKKIVQDDTLGNVDVADEHGMTPLMHCAYHGYVDQCKQLLSKGADANDYSCNQKDGYTALMFAAVAGHLEVVELLLRAGARTDTVNNLGKTATSMAAFVGQHEVAQMILNYFSMSELDEFTKVSKQRQRPRLSPSLATPLHSLLSTTHLHPVMILLNLQKEPALVDSAADVIAVLQTLSRRLVDEQREGLAVKLHYLVYLIQLAQEHGVDSVIARMLTFSEHGKAVEMDMLLRQCLREFSHPHLPILYQMIASLAKTDPGEDPTAYALIISVILGDKGAAAIADGCSTCGIIGEGKIKKCTRCKKAAYCSVQCQRLAWTKGNHNVLCKKWTASTES